MMTNFFLVERRSEFVAHDVSSAAMVVPSKKRPQQQRRLGRFQQQQKKCPLKPCFLMATGALLVVTAGVFQGVELDGVPSMTFSTLTSAFNGSSSLSPDGNMKTKDQSENSSSGMLAAAPNSNPLEDVFVRAGIAKSLPQAELDGLWQNISSLYYSKGRGPIILGTEHCAEFRAQHGTNITLGMAGLFNTGTNAMAKNLQTNLGIPGNTDAVWLKPAKTWGKLNGIEFEVPWWKHNPRFLVPPNNNSSTFYWECCTRDPIEHANVLPIVMVRDPLMWRNSMCKTPYAMSWYNSSKNPLLYHCPRPEVDPITYAAPFKWHSKKPSPKPFVYADSLYDAWNLFHQMYLQEVNFPRLLVRFEDAIVYLPEIIQTIQHCVGAYSKQTNTSTTTTASITQSANAAKHHSGRLHSTNLLQVIQKMANLAGRKAGMSSEELEYSQHALDPKLMELFGYRV